MAGAGDWQCPNVNCLNHRKMVFGSKSACPKCGSLKEADWSNESAVVNEADWSNESGLMNDSGEFDLVNSGSPYVNGTKEEQEDQDLHGAQGMKGGDMPGDWQCPNPTCINNKKMVFGKKASCLSCGSARNAQRPGDWLCPNSQCLNHRNNVFATRVTCPKCGTPRPMGGARAAMTQAYLAPSQPMVHAPQPASVRQFSNAQFNSAYSGGMGPSPGSALSARGGHPADWQCPNPSCVNHRRMVFARHTSCPQCGANKQPQGIGGNGDWQCPSQECINHRNKVFASKSSCPSCGHPRPDTGNRSRSPRRFAMGSSLR